MSFLDPTEEALSNESKDTLCSWVVELREELQAAKVERDEVRADLAATETYLRGRLYIDEEHIRDDPNRDNADLADLVPLRALVERAAAARRVHADMLRSGWRLLLPYKAETVIGQYITLAMRRVRDDEPKERTIDFLERARAKLQEGVPVHGRVEEADRTCCGTAPDRDHELWCEEKDL